MLKNRRHTDCKRRVMPGSVQTSGYFLTSYWLLSPGLVPNLSKTLVTNRRYFKNNTCPLCYVLLVDHVQNNVQTVFVPALCLICKMRAVISSRVNICKVCFSGEDIQIFKNLDKPWWDFSQNWFHFGSEGILCFYFWRKLVFYMSTAAYDLHLHV